MHKKKIFAIIIILFNLITSSLICFAENNIALDEKEVLEEHLELLNITSSNIWEIYKEAQNAFNDGQYGNAILPFRSVIVYFKNQNDYVNTALMYNRLSKCYGEIQNYDQAYVMSMKEAKYWDQDSNKVQEAIAARRKAGFYKQKVELYVEIDSSKDANNYYHNAKYEPIIGAYIGAYGENDPEVHNAWDPEKHYMTQFPEMTEKKHAAYLLYFTYGMDISNYESHFNKAKSKNVAIQLALQPVNGLEKVKDDAYLEKFAKDLNKFDIPIFLRFANEMNDPTSNWYTEPTKYIEKFRLVAHKIHNLAPNVVMVWSPNFYPPDNIIDYYPGDEYVDWVGASVYKEYLPELDPLKKNIDRGSFIENLDIIYSLYSDKKPIMISEGAVSYTSLRTGADITTWAKGQLKDFYTYIPMKYPNVKAIFYFDSNDNYIDRNIYRSFLLSTNDIILNTYKEAISNSFYLESIGDKANISYVPITNYILRPSNEKIYSYVKTVEPNIAKVIYKIDNTIIGTCYEAPWMIEYNFNNYKGQNIKIQVEAYDKNNKLLTKKIINANIADK